MISDAKVVFTDGISLHYYLEKLYYSQICIIALDKQ